MKRGTDTRDEDNTGRAPKVIHTEQEFLATTACFTEEKELKARDLTDREDIPEDRHILGQVFMLWPVSKNNCRLQLKTGVDSLDVVFEGPGVEKLGFMSRDMVKIALKGARKESKKAGSSVTLPFKLIFPNGAVVQLLASQKRERDKLVDLFQDAEERKRREEDNWFYSSPVAGNHHEDDWPTPKLSAPSQQAAHPFEDLGNDIPSEPLNYQGAQPNIAIDDLPTTLAISETLKPSVSNPPPAAVLHATTEIPVVKPPPPPHKEKRIKKRDTRHIKGSNSRSEDDILINAKDLADLAVQKTLGKKAKQRLAARLAKADARDSNRRLPTKLPPPRDPALDLTPGFHSNKGGLYNSIGSIVLGKTYSLVGMVIGVGETKTTRTGERSKSFILVDPSQHGDGFTVNVFVSQAEEDLLPSARVGQALLLRGVKIKEFFGKMQGTCYKDSFQWCGYDPTRGRHFYSVSESPSSSITRSSSHDMFFRITDAELEYFTKISDWWRAFKEAQEKPHDTGGITHTIPQVSNRRRKLTTIAEMSVGTFVDCVVELLTVKKHDQNTMICVTDYSENRCLYRHSEATDYPFGQRTLTVTLWDGVHAMADDLEVHGLYLLENMKLKMSAGYLEGSIGYQERGIRKIGPGSAQMNLPELLLRRKQYQENPHYSRLEVIEEQSELPEPMQQGHNVVTGGSLPDDGTVECLHMNQRETSIEDVHRSVICPNKFRIRARIVEYYPRRLENFMKVECNQCGKILGDGYRLCPACGDLTEGSTTVRYQFALRVVDQSGVELNIGVSGEEASNFLFGLSPRDARDDVEALRTRLSPLLGHLVKWHEEFDEGMEREEGPWCDLCVYSWVSEACETGTDHHFILPALPTARQKFHKIHPPSVGHLLQLFD